MTKRTEKKEIAVPVKPKEAPEITEVKKQIGWLKTELSRLESLLPKPIIYRSWYSSPAVWLALILTLFVIGMIALLYLTESGYSLQLLGHIVSRYGIK